MELSVLLTILHLQVPVLNMLTAAEKLTLIFFYKKTKKYVTPKENNKKKLDYQSSFLKLTKFIEKLTTQQTNCCLWYLVRLR